VRGGLSGNVAEEAFCLKSAPSVNTHKAASSESRGMQLNRVETWKSPVGTHRRLQLPRYRRIVVYDLISEARCYCAKKAKKNTTPLPQRRRHQATCVSTACNITNTHTFLRHTAPRCPASATV